MMIVIGHALQTAAQQANTFVIVGRLCWEGARLMGMERLPPAGKKALDYVNLIFGAQVMHGAVGQAAHAAKMIGAGSQLARLSVLCMLPWIVACGARGVEVIASHLSEGAWSHLPTVKKIADSAMRYGLTIRCLPTAGMWWTRPEQVGRLAKSQLLVDFGRVLLWAAAWAQPDRKRLFATGELVCRATGIGLELLRQYIYPKPEQQT